MAYCQECGSEVAPEDVFCPYCGIALPQSAPVAESSPPSSLSAASEAESLAPATEAAESSASGRAPESFSPLDGAAEPVAAEREAVASTAEVFAEKPVDDEAARKAELIEEDFSSYQPDAEASSAAEAADRDFSGEQPASVSAVNLNRVADASEIEGGAANDQPPAEVASSQPTMPDFSNAGNGFAAQTAPSGATDVSESPAAPDAENPEAADFTATIPYVSRDLPQPEVLSAPENSPENEKDAISETVMGNLASAENASVAENNINPPAAPLPEPVQPTPLYISIQPKEDSANAAPAKAVESSPAPPIANFTPAALPENKAERGSTSPNIGVGETDGKKAAKLKPLDEGTVLNGRYEIVRKIGGGGMGAVYLASDRNLGGVLRAVKEMVQSYIEDEQQEKAVNDFRRESTILSTLDHPSIPTIYDYFYDDKESRFYLVMKYINGGDLAARLRSAPEGRIDEKSVTEWAIQIADVLDYLHNRPATIIYRDLKPSNVMIDGNSGRVMLIDFGIARSVNKEEKGVTAVGTMGYAPPELFSGNVEPRSDIYSLGSTMFHLLTGADPQSNPLLIFDFNKNPRPRQINSRLSDQIEGILMRSVEYNSAQRFASAAELREILTKHLENLKTGAVTYGVASQAAMSAAQQKPQNTPVFCGFCGQKILATDMFCPFCGAQQPLASQAAKPAPPAFVAPKMTARLMVIGTNELDAPEFSLEKETNLVGRRDPMSNIFPEVDLSKFDPQTKISRRHARIWRENSAYLLEDLGSSNGTVLMPPAKDSVRLLPRQPHALSHGDKIRVGDTTLHFFIG